LITNKYEKGSRQRQPALAPHGGDRVGVRGRRGGRASPHVHPIIAATIVCAVLSACGSAPTKRDSPIDRAERPARVGKAPSSSSTSPRTSRGGGYYLDDGPGDSPPADIDTIPDAVPRLEPLHRGAMRPYVVMGQSYTPMTELTPYKARGSASWYGRRYHGKQTSSGELYDMYSMTAAHPVLPIPSYVRVTNVTNGKSVVVRVNDRGPFIDSRLIDLSYTAAHRIGVLAGGSALVEVESILPDASGPSGTMMAVAPPSRWRAPPARSAPPPAPAAAPVLAASAPELSAQPDPILAIAAAARDSVPAGTPLGDSTPDPAPQPAPMPRVAAETVLLAFSRPAAPEATGVYLQLGAFGSKENAESYLARAKVQVEWAAQLLHLFPRDGMYRVHAGPYATSSEARLAAERIATALGTKPMVVSR
jgi:rare lipoprotein A